VDLDFAFGAGAPDRGIPDRSGGWATQPLSRPRDPAGHGVPTPALVIGCLVVGGGGGNGHKGAAGAFVTLAQVGNGDVQMIVADVGEMFLEADLISDIHHHRVLFQMEIVAELMARLLYG